MSMTRNLLHSIILVLSFIFICHCGEPDRITFNNDEDTFQDINSKDDFDAAINEVGSASGNQYTGYYEITSSGLNYSNDCEAEFILAYDFFVDLSLPVEEVEDQIENGTESATSILPVTQEDGVIIFEGIGDDGTDLTGAVNNDGSFQVVSGVYPDEDNYFFSVYEGEFSKDAISGTFQARIHTEDYDPSGTCSVQESFGGPKLSEDAITDPTFPTTYLTPSI